MDTDTLVERIRNRSVTVGIVGVGYVGLPLALGFTEAGFDVIGYDIDEERIGMLSDGRSYIDDIEDDRVETLVESGFEPTTNRDQLERCDAFLIAVPTTVEDGQPDMSAVRAAAETIATQRDGQSQPTLVNIVSTVYPGATNDVVAPIFTARGFTRGKDVLLAMVPERVNPGSEYGIADIPLVVGADSDHERTVAKTLLDLVVEETHKVSSTTVAEATKTLENAYRNVNIALVNELAGLAEQLGVNIWEIIEAASRKPFGFQAFYPGPGVGGHCIPVDPYFLTWQADRSGVELSVLERALRTNEQMPARVSQDIQDVLAAREIEVDDAHIVIMGVSYKPNVADTRNSPALEISAQLNTLGAELTLVDPLVDEVTLNGITYEPLDSYAAVEADVDLVAVLVDHAAFDFSVVAEQAPAVYDAQYVVPPGDTVVQLGVRTVLSKVQRVGTSHSGTKENPEQALSKE